MKCCRFLSHFNLLVRLVTALLNTLSVCLWAVWGPEAIPPYSPPAGPLLFIHAIAGCLFVLPALVLPEMLGETPGTWTQRVFSLMALVLHLPLGGIGIYLSVTDGTALQIGVATLCLTVGLLMLADFAHLEKLYCWYKIKS